MKRSSNNPKENKMAEQNGRYVLVTTAHRGVFGGFLVGEPAKEKVTLTKARNCLYWSSDVRGFVGLAEKGPTAGCRVGPAAPELTLFDITAVIVCTPEAAQAWEGVKPWKS
jgi:hypothetical protein